MVRTRIKARREKILRTPPEDPCDRSQGRPIETLSEKLFDLLDHHRWTLEISCLAAIDNTLQALGETAPGGHSHAKHSHSLAVLLATKFEHTDDLMDLQEAVVHAENAVSVLDHPDRGAHLSTLVETLLLRYRWMRNLDDLGQSILYAKMAVAQASQGSSERVRCLLKLIDLLRLRFEATDDISDLENAISHATKAEQESHGFQSQIACMSRLADLLFEKYKWMDSFADLNLAVLNAVRVVDEIAEDHPDHPIYLYKLITLLFRKHSQLEHTLSLEEAILHTSRVIPRLWCNAGLRALLKSEALFEKLESIHDNDKLKHALLLEIKAPEPQSPSHLYRLADTLFEKFKLRGDLSALEKAILNVEKAVAETHPSHRNRIIYLHKLVALLAARFKKTKAPDDLSLTILHVEGILSESQESSDRAVHFLMLGDILVEKFNLTNDPAVLESAIQRVRMAIVESQVGSLHRAACLSELAYIHTLKFKRTKDLDAVTKATAYREKAMSEVAAAHTQDIYLSKKQTTVAIGAEQVDDLGDRESALSRSQKAVLVEDFRDSGGLFLSLQNPAAKKHEFNDLDLAISHAEAAVRTKRGLAARMASQSDFAALLNKRFWLKRDHADLRLTMTLLVSVFVYEWARNGESSHLQRAISHIKDLIENDIIIFPRAAILLGLEPRPWILKILDKAVFNPNDLVEINSVGIKRAASPLKLLSIAVALGRRKELPRFNSTEILSVWEHATIKSVKLGRLIAGLSSPNKRFYDPFPPSQIKSTVTNHLEDATPDEDWESLRTKVFDKNTQSWTFEYKAQTVKLFDDDTLFATAYARPETRSWLGPNKMVHLVTGYQTCVSEEVMKRVAAEEMDARDAAKKGRIFSIRYVNVML